MSWGGSAPGWCVLSSVGVAAFRSCVSYHVLGVRRLCLVAGVFSAQGLWELIRPLLEGWACAGPLKDACADWTEKRGSVGINFGDGCVRFSGEEAVSAPAGCWL